ncbi:type I restriction-modification system endonuclease [Paenibacillus oryzisoli]|uniref:Type I restriction-modification system endonuclease n=1 Tax=Paenibacillus oryzisoli TaxID=1850517 RepID=A0A198AJZ5_9BACL|nr:type I restriction-modification system endonuclease [Paenibacillus oryzisoli]OAS21361.1 type I restriction-modification system endonuclease [Paenibacillus oryzisoli]
MAGNFEFLHNRWEILSNLGEMAERNLFADPNTSLIKLRMFGETLTKFICAIEEMDETKELTQVDRLSQLKRDDLISDEIVDMLHTLRKIGNKANHEAGYGSTREAQTLTHLAFRIGVWFMQVYGNWDFQAPEFMEPTPQDNVANQEQLGQLAKSYEDKMVQLQQELVALRQQQTTITHEVKKKRHTKSKQAGSAFTLTEAETRLIIDEKLRQVGWEADSQTLRFGHGVRPEKGRNLAIAEWALKTGFADYALFCGLELVGIVEAKRISKNVEADIAQAKKYAMQVVRHGDEIIHGPWGNYQVPFLFSTNGRPYLEQLKHMSGIWFLDSRKPTNHPRPLQAWYSPQGLKSLLQQDLEQSTQALQDETLDYLKLRPYQEDAILSVERAIESGQRNILLAMATGTGKTRMAIGLIYRLIKHNRFKRILFLVDRSALGRQAEAAFKDSKLESYHSFTEIFELQTLDDKKPNQETKVQIATVQGMVKRLFYCDSEDIGIPTVDQYDCIIVDEAHRGYTLDKEMSELELEFRDHEDYVSKYRKVLDYFDAVRIGLTATPALHTVDIFGRPVFNYSYREAVIDGYLIDHEPPMQFETQLKKYGIKWQIGEEVAVYDVSSGSIDKEMLQDEINLEVTQFNKTVITENFNRVILEELTKYIDPESEGKTLIFAATDDHADMVVRIFKEELEKVYGTVDDNAVLKITGSIKDPLHAIKLFKNERLPSIVVTVDLLTTGIDIPSITNLVFLRRLRSRILYEQMLGRATRRCDEIGKDHFMIYDAVGIYETLKPYTDMKPVVTKPSITLDVLTDELFQIYSEEKGKQHKDEIVAKMQRKKRTWTSKDHEDFKALSGGMSIEKFITDLKNMSALQAGADLQVRKSLVAFIDENRGRAHRIYISEHEDKLLSTTRGYGNAEKPEDYLEGFQSFINENMNLIPALTIICKRPNDLTRDELRKLRVALDQQGYSEKMLQAAWRDAKNEDIAADIISFIRQQALGDPLISHEERIEGAMKKIYDMKVWSKVQKDWLKRIEKQLLQESVLDPSPEKAFDVEPFKSKGGYRQLNKIFDGEMDTIVTTINTALYTPRKRDLA